MKTFRLFFSIFILAGLTFIACEETGDDESCDSQDLSEDFSCPTDVDAVATFCSDGVNNSYYTYGGSKYECTGVEASTCDDAIAAIGEELIDAGCGSKKVGEIKLNSMAIQLLEEVRTKSVCE